MSGRVLLGLSSFTVGIATAACATLTGGLLLYSADGLLRALAVVLAVLSGALGAGIAVDLPRDVTFRLALRRRWRGLVVSFVVAALFAGVWSFMGDGASSSLNLGLGLTFLGAVPMFAAGTVLGAASRIHEWVAPPGAQAFAWGAGGAAAGVLLSGAAMSGTRFLPPTLLMLCVVILSAGAVVQTLGIDQLESDLVGDGAVEEPS
jgi:hypothetical protein